MISLVGVVSKGRRIAAVLVEYCMEWIRRTLIIRLAGQAPTRGGQSLHFEVETFCLASG